MTKRDDLTCAGFGQGDPDAPVSALTKGLINDGLAGPIEPKLPASLTLMPAKHGGFLIGELHSDGASALPLFAGSLRDCLGYLEAVYRPALTVPRLDDLPKTWGSSPPATGNALIDSVTAAIKEKDQ